MKDKTVYVITGQKISKEKKLSAIRMRKAPTKAENILWQVLRNRKLGVKFRRQQLLFGFIADFYSDECRLVIEADSNSHDKDYDSERDIIFEGSGITVLRLSNDEINLNLENVLSMIEKYI